VDKCGPLVKIWDGHGDWQAWANKFIEEVRESILYELTDVCFVLQQGEPQISPIFGTYHDQSLCLKLKRTDQLTGRWIIERDDVTSDNELRNFYLVEAFPAFTKVNKFTYAVTNSLT